jgi:DNA polymerase
MGENSAGMSLRRTLIKEHLERTYGPGAFVTRHWLETQLAGRRAAAAPAPPIEGHIPIINQPAPAAPEAAPATLELIRADIGDCRRCKLCEKRTNIVFGEGSPTARLMFIGEGPGEQEDLQGRPFVGAAGKLLDKIIEAMGFRREDVYIGNVVKCRPPGNRAPEPDEAGACEQFLFRQIEVIRPRILVALGGTALKCLLHEDAKITKMRGRFMDYTAGAHTAKLMPTFHPAFLLRNPDAKKDVWDDMKKVKAELGI